MNISPSMPTAAATSLAGLSPLHSELAQLEGGNARRVPGKSKDPSEVARQFEAVLVKQILSESMKSMMEHGEGGQVYGYFLEDTLADGITKGGGMGLRSILETQLRQRMDPSKNEQAAASDPSQPTAVKSSKKTAVTNSYKKQ